MSQLQNSVIVRIRNLFTVDTPH
ncbi:MAG: hypothetical protein RL431_893, partial [Actinomycetota bacterium]